ncbi:calcium-binding protein [Bradyrhizobium sp. JR3.5]
MVTATTPTSGFDVLIDGYSDTNTDPNANSGGDGNRISKDQNGMGLHNSNLETGETIFFEFGAQQSAFSLVVGKATTTSEHFLVTLYDQNHNFIASENVVLPDGSTLLVDAAHWGTGGTGTTSGAFGNFYEVDIKNVAAGGSEDSSIVITGFQFNEQVTVGNTALNFNLTTTDGDGDSFTSSDNLTVLLQGTHTGNGYQLTGANGAPEVLAASAGADTLIGGTGGGDTVDYSNTTGGVGVTIDLSAETDTVAATVGQAATGDVIKGVENIIGTQYADILTAAPGGSILIGGGGNDTLNGGVGNDTLIGGAGDDTLSGGGGNNIFVLQGSGGGHDSISGFSALADQIFVDVASQNLTIGTSTGITAGQFTSSAATGSDENALNAWNESASANKFFFNNASGELWYSANGTGADKVDLAHVSTGVPAAANIHTM